jgi:hypothetical protein
MERLQFEVLKSPIILLRYSYENLEWGTINNPLDFFCNIKYFFVSQNYLWTRYL